MKNYKELPKGITIFEVGPRDGLQNEPEFIPTEKKINLINKLTEAGCNKIEIGSFVHPKWIPQLIGIISLIVTMAIGWQQVKGTVEEQGREIARIEKALTEDVSLLTERVERHREQLADSKLADALLESKVDNLMKLAEETASDVKELVRRKGK